MYIFEISPNLLLFCLKDCRNITEKSLVHLAYVCNKLESLIIYDASCFKSTDIGMIAIPDNCSNLKVLGIRKTIPLEHMNFEYAAKKCRILESAALAQCAIIYESICLLNMYAVHLRVLELCNNDLITG